MANIACLRAQERVFGSNPGVRPGFTTNNNVSCCSLLLSNVQCNNALRAIFLATLTLFFSQFSAAVLPSRAAAKVGRGVWFLGAQAV